MVVDNRRVKIVAQDDYNQRFEFLNCKCVGVYHGILEYRNNLFDRELFKDVVITVDPEARVVVQTCYLVEGGDTMEIFNLIGIRG